MMTEPYRCLTCNSAFGSAYDRERHEQLAHKEKTMPSNRFECDTCDRDFASAHALKIHAARAHGKTVLPIDVPTIAAPEAVTQTVTPKLPKPVIVVHSTPSSEVAVPALNASPDWRDVARDYQLDAINAYARLALAHLTAASDEPAVMAEAICALDELLRVAS